MSLSKKSSNKEKLMNHHYELLFTKEQNELLSNQPDYWETFFFLQPNCASLQSHIRDSLKCKDKTGKKLEAIKLLFSQCTVALKEESNVRIANALFTMCLVSKFVLIKKKKAHTYDAFDILIGNDSMDVKIEILRTRLCELLFSEGIPTGSKALILDFLLILVTAGPSNLNDHPILPHLMSDHLFDAFVNASLTLTSRHVLGFKALLLLTLLVNYKREDMVNPFMVKLSLIHDEVVLNAFAHVICSVFCDFNGTFEQKNEGGTTSKSSSSLFSSITSMVGSMFIADDDSHISNNVKLIRSCPVKANHNSLLLALYYAIHLNRNFIILLTNFAAEPLDEFTMFNNAAGMTLTPSDAASQSGSLRSNSDSGPCNLLVAFLEFCSIVMLNTKDDSSCKTSRLCFIILTSISEDSCANGIMHDSNMAFRVSLHRMPMRHRKLSQDQVRQTSKPLAHTVLDLMVEFILSNLRKSLPLDLHSFALGIMHRIICYQKRCKIRFNYPWTEIWSTLISLIKYLVNHESDLLKSTPSHFSDHSHSSCSNNNNNQNILSLIQMSVNIFNLFITYGDTFLSSDQSYDQLYYEIIRMHMVFDNLYLLCSRFTGMESSPFKQASADMVTSLTNIRSIINHFNPKIDAWKSDHEIESLTEEHVLQVVRSNYDSLSVMMLDGVDCFDSYSPDSGNESLFFQQMLERVISEYRDTGIFREQEYSVKHAALVQELESSINSGHHADEEQVENGPSNRQSTCSQSTDQPVN